MKREFAFLILLISMISCKPNNKLHFKKIIYDLNDPKQKEAFEHWKKNNLVKGDYPFNYDTTDTRYLNLFLKHKVQWPCPCVFKDSIWTVYSLCFGEFGGFLFFEERKKPDCFYVMGAQCATLIDYFDNSFYLTLTLPHMNGGGEIVKVKDPKNLVRIKKEDLSYWSHRYIEYTNSRELKKFAPVDSILYNQGQTLLDTFGYNHSSIELFLLYPYNRMLIVVYTKNWNKLMIAELKNKQLFPIDSIACPNLVSANLEGNFVINRTYCYKYMHSWNANDYNYGYIYLKKDTVVIAKGTFYKPPEVIDTSGMNLQ